MLFDNLTESLDKLETVAAKHCCLGAWNGPGEELTCCYVTMGDLMSRNRQPELRYIEYPFKSRTHGGEFTARTGFISWELNRVD